MKFENVFDYVNFISQAGLLIGEMILAVNKDLLVDCNYDSVRDKSNVAFLIFHR